MTSPLDIKGKSRRDAITLLAGWLLLVLLMAGIWSVPPATEKLPDTDDYMRMVRVFAIIDGEHLPSYAVPGLGIDEKGEVGWSRLTDWPLALMQGTLEKFMPRETAALYTGTIMPALALLLFLPLALWCATPLLPDRRAALPVVIAMFFLWVLLRQFMPGRVDHHMWQASLSVIAYGSLFRLWFTPERLRYAVIAGAAFATGLAIGADIMPGFVLGTALLGFFWWIKGDVYQRPGLLYGLALFAATAAYHIVLHDPGRFITASCDALSMGWVGMTAAVMLFWGGVSIIPDGLKQGIVKRLLCGIGVFLPLMAALYLLFPFCFGDIYQIRYPVLNDLWLHRIAEVLPLNRYAQLYPAAAAFFVVPPLAALLACLWAIKREPENRILWAGLALVLGGALAATFYHVRTVDFAQTIAVAPLAWLLIHGKDYASARLSALSARQRLTGAGIFFALALIGFVLALPGRDDRAVEPEEPVTAGCDLQQASESLNALPPGQIVAGPLYAGSELLYRTHHNILVASVHRNQDSMMVVYHIFTAANADAAREAVEQSGATVLILCDTPDNFWVEYMDGKPSFAEELLSSDVPDWLEPLGSAEDNGGYLIFRRTE
ncbi:MAG: hypothetical protein H6867_11115 [Rhodospirillales bacterium]|nr:hypothetical protein [Rhodospirillales bacterium]MCB9996679.1 hypothetical protein [Rhodospirillales bacterium]